MSVQLTQFLTTLPAYTAGNDVLFAEEIPALRAKKTLGEVFWVIGDYCSWFNHSLLGSIIKAFCPDDESIRQSHKEFCDKFRKYCRHRACKCYLKSGSGLRKKEKREHITLKVDKEWNTVTLEQLKTVKFNVARILKVKDNAIYLLSAEHGCVQLTFLLLKPYSLSPANKKLLW